MCVYTLFVFCFRTPLSGLEVENPSFTIPRGFEEQEERRKNINRKLASNI